MSIKKRKFNIKNIFTAIFIITYSIWLQAFGADFSPLEVIADNPFIKLDSTKISSPEFNFPSPSEYQTQIYRNSGNTFEPPTIQPLLPESSIPEPFYVENIPTENNKNEILTDTKENKESLSPITEDDSLKRKDAAEKIKFIPFNKQEDLIQPSDYEYAKKIKSTPAVKEELIPEFSYYASAQNNYFDDDNYDGKTVSSIKISGINKIKPQIVLNAITTKEGSLFNTDLLQQDLQKIFALGYFTENISIEPNLLSDGTVELVFNLEENIVIKNIKINGNTVYSDAELYTYLNELINMPQNINVINKCISNINKHYEEQGYILAHVTSIDDSSDGTLIININEGVIEKFEFNEDKKTKDFVIERNMLTKAGGVYNEELLKKDIVRIYATQLFDDIERTIEPSPDKEGQYIVKIKVKESSSDNITIGGGVDSALGVFGSVGINNKNFLGRGQFLGISGMLGSGILLSDSSIKNRVNYNIELNFREPYFLNENNSLAAKMYFRGLGSYQVPLAVEKRLGINGTITRKISKYDNLKASLGLGIEHIHLSEGDRDKIQSMYHMRNISFSERSKQLTGGTFLNISPSIIYSNLDDEYMPRNGMIAKASFNEAVGISRIKNTNGRLAGKITKYIPLFKKSSLALTARAGLKVHGDNMPEVMAFGLGGPYTIRGFRMNGVGTGNSFVMGSAEIQTPIPFFDRFKYDILKNMRFAVFADAGKVFSPTISAKLYDRPLSAISAGIGLRIYIPGVGPISIDYAVPFTHVGAYNHRGGYFTFGTSGLYDN